MLQNGQMFLLPEEDINPALTSCSVSYPSAAEHTRFLLGQQDFGEKSEQRVVEPFGLHAAAVHQRVDDSAHQNTVN